MVFVLEMQLGSSVEQEMISQYTALWKIAARTLKERRCVGEYVGGWGDAMEGLC